MATPISGKNGKVLSGATTLAEITGWRWNPTSNNPAWASSSNAGTKQRVAGVKDGSGSFDFKIDTDDELYDDITEGSSVTLYLYLNATLFFTVPAIVDGVSYECDINDGEPVGGTVDFSQNGTVVNP